MMAVIATLLGFSRYYLNSVGESMPWGRWFDVVILIATAMIACTDDGPRGEG
jgi:hypothetical protein